MIDDIEKNRAEYVALLESRVKHFEASYLQYKQLADKWTPEVTVEQTDVDQVKIGLRFGGKNVHATVKSAAIAGSDIGSVTASITDALVESLVIDLIRAEIQPKLEVVQKNIINTSGAGKW